MIRKEPPPYGHRRGWIPRTLEDYGDGGAFPEIHVAQFPLNMGKKKTTVSSRLILSPCFGLYGTFHTSQTSSAVVPLQLDSSGRVKYDILAKMGQRKDKVVHTSLQAMVPKERPTDPELLKPDEEEIEKVGMCV